MKEQFVINGREGFSREEYIKCLVARYDSLEEVLLNHWNVPKDIRVLLANNWDDIEPLTVEEAFAEENLERRRIFFDHIGPGNIVKQANAIEVDKQTIPKKHTRWDENDEEYIHEFEDTYTLLKMRANDLFTGTDEQDSVSDDWIYTVRCKCSTTDREYFIYVDPNNYDGNDAIAAIASTFFINVNNPKAIYRQGDVLLVEPNGEPQYGRYRPLSKDEYLNLIVSET